MAVFAEEAAGYPDIIEELLAFENLTDYAVGDGETVFADGQTLVRWNERDETTRDYSAGESVTDVDYSGGKFFYRTASGTYELPPAAQNQNMPGNPAEHDFSVSMESFPKDEGFTYYKDGSEIFHVLIQSSNENKEYSGYTKIKPYNGSVYAVKENCLYNISKGQEIKQEFRYSNYDLLTKIPAGESAAGLKNFSQTPSRINITSGNVTKIADSEAIVKDGHFNTGDKDTARENTRGDLTGIALLLAETENTYVAAVGTDVYILNKKSAVGGGQITPAEENAESTPNCFACAYSLPFVSKSTEIFEISPADRLKVVAFIPKGENGFLAHDFYAVEKSTDGGTLKGYVPKEFLNELNYNFNEGGTTVTPDPAPENGDNIRTVVLVLLIVLLALIAAGYLVWLFTTGRKTIKSKSAKAAAAPSEAENERGDEAAEETK